MIPAGLVDGVIGQDVLAGLVFTIDYRRRQISWHGDTAPERPLGTRLPLQVTSGRLLVTLPQASDPAGGLRLVPDSGADVLVLLTHTGRPLPFVTPLDTVPVRGVSGILAARRVLVQNLEVGTIRLADQVAVLLDGTAAGGYMGDGLLPLRLFARVTFNAGAGYVVFEGTGR